MLITIRILHNRLDLLPLPCIPRARHNKHLRTDAVPITQPTDRPGQLTDTATRTEAVLHIHFEVLEHQLVDLANQRHPTHVLQLPFELFVHVCPPAVEVGGRVSLEPVFFARDEQCHASLDVDRSVIEGEAQLADVGVLRREEPLARVWQAGVVAHEVKGVVREVVVHRFLAHLLADEEELCLRGCR